jgi:hypothetical protein
MVLTLGGQLVWVMQGNGGPNTEPSPPSLQAVETPVVGAQEGGDEGHGLECGQVPVGTDI